LVAADAFKAIKTSAIAAFATMKAFGAATLVTFTRIPALIKSATVAMFSFSAASSLAAVRTKLFAAAMGVVRVATVGLVTVFNLLKVAVFTNPLFLLGAAIVGGLIAAFVIFEDEIRAVGQSLKDLIPNWEKVAIAAFAVVEAIIENWRTLPTLLKEIAIDAINKTVKAFKSGGNELIAVLNKFGADIEPFKLTDVIETPRDEVNRLRDELSAQGISSEFAGPDAFFDLTALEKFRADFTRIARDIEDKGLSASFSDRLEKIKQTLAEFTLGGLDADEMEKVRKEIALLSGSMNGLSGVTKTLQTRFDKLVDKFDPIASAARKTKEALEALRAVSPGSQLDEQQQPTGSRFGIDEEGAKLLKFFKRDLVGVGNEAEILDAKLELLRRFALDPANGISDGELAEAIRVLREDTTKFTSNIEQINLAATFDPAIDLAEKLRTGLITLNTATRNGNAAVTSRSELIRNLTRESLGLDNEQKRLEGTTKIIDAALARNNITAAEAVVLRKDLSESTRLFNAEQNVDSILAQTDALLKSAQAVKKVKDAFDELRAAGGDASEEEAAIVRARREAVGIGNEQFESIKREALIRKELTEGIITEAEARKLLIKLEEDSSKFKAEQRLLSQIAAVNKLVAANKKLADIEREFDKLRTDGVGTEKEREEVLRRTIRDLVGVGNATTDLAEKQQLLNSAFKQGAITLREYKQLLRDARIDFLETQTDFASGFERGLLKVRKDLEDFASAAEAAVTSAFGAMKDSLADFIETGEFSLENFINTIRRSFAELAAQSLLNEALGGLEQLFGINLGGTTKGS
jgi:hypothetical protein